MPRAPLDLAPERVFDLRQLVRIDSDGLQFDANAVRSQVSEASGPSDPKPRGAKKRASRAGAIDAVKKVLREQILVRKSTLAKDWNVDTPPLEQTHLAELVGVHKSTISRILKEETEERELQILWQIVNDAEQIMRYQR